MATQAQRDHGVAVMDLFHRFQAQVRYPPGDQRTGRDSFSWTLTEHQLDQVFAAGDEVQFDCSELGAYVLKLAGVWPWRSPGYTGSHLASLPHYSDGRLALPGALVVFGPGTGHHEAVVHTADPAHGDPLVFEHGSDRLCDIVRCSEVVSRQTKEGYPGRTFLSIANL